QIVKEKELFFVDSLTSSRSTAYQTAKDLHVPAALRNIFLDNLPDESAICRQLHKLRRHARNYGTAIGIGHPYQETLTAIARYVPLFKESGIDLVPISDLIQPNDSA
ncbi:MAG: divergent polysaccharide deacetylase family protein, partial [Pseudomonadota bacterium]